MPPPARGNDVDEFQQVLLNLQAQGTEVAVLIGNAPVAVKVQAVQGSHVTLYATQSRARYDLHYSQVVFVGSQPQAKGG